MESKNLVLFALLEGRVRFWVREKITFLKSAICEAYCEGILLLLGGLGSCGYEWNWGKCSSVMNLLISNNRNESNEQIIFNIGLDIPIYLSMQSNSTSESLTLPNVSFD